jgi:ATP-dependent DNA helicase DinG
MTLSYSDLLANFPKPHIRSQQDYVLREIASGIGAGYKIIVLEAPTGFGKSAVAVALARALGESYICTGTKYLQDHIVQTLLSS